MHSYVGVDLHRCWRFLQVDARVPCISLEACAATLKDIIEMKRNIDVRVVSANGRCTALMTYRQFYRR